MRRRLKEIQEELRKTKVYSTKANVFASEVLEREVKSAPDYYDGQIEALEAKLDRAVDVIGRMLDAALKDGVRAEVYTGSVMLLREGDEG